MLYFECDVCGKKYEIASVDGNDSFSYQDNNRRLKGNTSDPCQDCLEEAEKARKEALEKRKALRQI